METGGKRKDAPSSEEEGGGGLSLPGAAQGCWRRVCETKHDASEAEGPSNKAKEGGEKGRVTLR